MIKKAIISNSPTITPIITTSIGENTPGITLKNQSNRSNVNSTQLDDHNHVRLLLYNYHIWELKKKMSNSIQ